MNDYHSTFLMQKQTLEQQYVKSMTGSVENNATMAGQSSQQNTSFVQSQINQGIDILARGDATNPSVLSYQNLMENYRLKDANVQRQNQNIIAMRHQLTMKFEQCLCKERSLPVNNPSTNQMSTSVRQIFNPSQLSFTPSNNAAA